MILIPAWLLILGVLLLAAAILRAVLLYEDLRLARFLEEAARNAYCEASDGWRRSDERWLAEWALMVPCVTALQALVDTISIGAHVWSVMPSAEKALQALRAHRDERQKEQEARS